MSTFLMKKDDKKHFLCKSEKQGLEIFYYEEGDGSFSVCLSKNDTLITYGSFSLKSVAKQMGYWLSGQFMHKNVVTEQEFLDASFEYGTHLWKL